MKLKIPATQYHHHEHAVCARWLAISQVWFLYGLPTYALPTSSYSPFVKSTKTIFQFQICQCEAKNWFCTCWEQL